MCAGRVACCPLVSHVEYAPHALLVLEKDALLLLEERRVRQTDGRTNARPLHYAYLWSLDSGRGRRNNKSICPLALSLKELAVMP